MKDCKTCKHEPGVPLQNCHAYEIGEVDEVEDGFPPEHI